MQSSGIASPSLCEAKFSLFVSHKRAHSEPFPLLVNGARPFRCLLLEPGCGRKGKQVLERPLLPCAFEEKTGVLKKQIGQNIPRQRKSPVAQDPHCMESLSGF